MVLFNKAQIEYNTIDFFTIPIHNQQQPMFICENHLFNNYKQGTNFIQLWKICFLIPKNENY